jgi:hypothetical protein
VAARAAEPSQQPRWDELLAQLPRLIVKAAALLALLAVRPRAHMGC